MLKSKGDNSQNENQAEVFNSLLAAAHSAADAAQPVTLKYFRQTLDVANKAGPQGFDPVTVADQSAETAIVAALKERFPDHAILGEEHGTQGTSGPYHWVIDPIDGTRAFIMGSPLWGTMIGLLNDGQPALGLIDQPFTGERFWSTENTAVGRWHGTEHVLQTRACKNLKDAVLTSTHPDLFEGAGRHGVFADLKKSARMTRFGGDCYGYCLLASGHIDLIIESGLKNYDVVALIPVIERAGGCITTWDGQSAANGGDIIASGDKRLHEAVLKRISKLM